MKRLSNIFLSLCIFIASCKNEETSSLGNRYSGNFVIDTQINQGVHDYWQDTKKLIAEKRGEEALEKRYDFKKKYPDDYKLMLHNFFREWIIIDPKKALNKMAEIDDITIKRQLADMDHDLYKKYPDECFAVAKSIGWEFTREWLCQKIVVAKAEANPEEALNFVENNFGHGFIKRRLISIVMFHLMKSDHANAQDAWRKFSSPYDQFDAKTFIVSSMYELNPANMEKLDRTIFTEDIMNCAKEIHAKNSKNK